MANLTTVDTANAVEAEDAPVNPLVALVTEGQGVWLDAITRDLIRSSELARLIEQDGLHGLTANPTLYQQAIAASDAYDDHMRVLIAAGKEAPAIVEALAVQDVQAACDVFRPVYDQTYGADGLVSIAVAPGLAHQATAR